jgi:hypothetical protein
LEPDSFDAVETGDKELREDGLVNIPVPPSIDETGTDTEELTFSYYMLP